MSENERLREIIVAQALELARLREENASLEVCRKEMMEEAFDVVLRDGTIRCYSRQKILDLEEEEATLRKDLTEVRAHEARMQDDLERLRDRKICLELDNLKLKREAGRLREALAALFLQSGAAQGTPKHDNEAEALARATLIETGGLP